jgi:hypothetical protein
MILGRERQGIPGGLAVRLHARVRATIDTLGAPRLVAIVESESPEDAIITAKT